MTVTITPSRASGRVLAPFSKSMGHRLLICAAMAEGKSTVHGISDSADMKATLACLGALGVSFTLDGETATIEGIDLRHATPKKPLYCNESGSTLRFLIPPALLSGSNVLFTGERSLFRRPMTVYEQICSERGLLFSADEQSAVVKGPLSAGEYRVAGNISSQFISGLLFALPLLDEDSVIRITPPLESRSYIGLTVSALEKFGVKVLWRDDYTLFIPGKQKYIPSDVSVEGDYSGAAFLEAFNLFGGNVTVEGLSKDSLQGDRVYHRFFPMLTRGTPTIHIGDCPDLGPILFAVASAKSGAVFTGTARLRLKESDRIAAMAEELAKFGVSVTAEGDSAVVYPADFHTPTEPLCGHNDHRIVMALATLCTMTGGEIVGAEAVKKSFPDFFEKIKALGVGVSVTDEG